LRHLRTGIARSCNDMRELWCACGRPVKRRRRADGEHLAWRCCERAVRREHFPADHVGAVGDAGRRGAPGGRAATTLKFDAVKLSQADKITGVASFILLISLFLPWFSVHVAFGTYSGSGESVHGYLWIVFLLCLGLVAYLGARAFLPQLPFKLPLPHERLVLAVTAVNLVLVVLAFVFKPGGFGLSGVGWSFGAFWL